MSDSLSKAEIDAHRLIIDVLEKECEGRDAKIAQLQADLERMTETRDSHSKVRQRHLVRYERACGRNKKLQAKVKRLEVENIGLDQIVDERKKRIVIQSYLLKDRRIENERLRAAIKETLEENGHLADGDVCTLLKLKQALEG